MPGATADSRQAHASVNSSFAANTAASGSNRYRSMRFATGTSPSGPPTIDAND